MTGRPRRWLLGAGLALAAAPLAVIPARARAAALTPKSQVMYRYAPNGDQRCGLCASFIASDRSDAPGTCKIVEGPIPPDGWCSLFSKR